jgi:hypothetical protein
MRVSFVKVKLVYDWRPTANQLVLASSPSWLTTRDLFLQMNPCDYSPYVTSSLTTGWVCLLWIGFASLLLSVRIAHIADYWKFLLVHYVQVLCQSKLCKADHAVLLILCYNGSLVTWTVVSLTTAKFKPLIFSISGSALCYAAKIFILMILYDFCLLPAQFCYTVVYIYIMLKVVC